MPEFKSHKQGTFCWSDLGTTDQEGAKKFYGELFGWSGEDMPMGPDAVYTMFKKNGKTTAATFTQDEAMRKAGIPPFWSSYIAVDNVDSMAEKAVALGATLAMPVMDVFEAGRMAYIKDPADAHIGLWQGKNHIGAELKHEAGTLTWAELLVKDTAKATAFYEGLFGWTHETMPTGTDPYTMFINDGEHVCGMMKLTPEMGAMPPSWSPYFNVDDVAASHAKATSLGAKTIIPPQVIPGMGHFAILFDPQGAGLYLYDSKK